MANWPQSCGHNTTDNNHSSSVNPTSKALLTCGPVEPMLATALPRGNHIDHRTLQTKLRCQRLIQMLKIVGQNSEARATASCF